MIRKKHALGPRPDGWVPVFPRDKHEAFARRSCSNKKIVPLPCRGLERCSRRYLLGLAHRKARAARQRERRPFAVLGRCNLGELMLLRATSASQCNFGEPMQLRRAHATSIVGKDFLPAIALEEPVVGQGHGRFAITGRYSCATDLPDVSKCFRRDSSRHPCQRPPCYFAWGCFRYFGW